MKYTGTCKDRENKDIRVEIYTPGGGEDQTITIVEEGIIVNYEADSIFKPVKKSSASITILTDNMPSDFYTGQLLNPTVFIYKNDSLWWSGFVTPTAFTQSFVLPKEPLTINCVDSLARLDYVDYTYVHSSTSSTTFNEILAHILKPVATEANITDIYVTTTLSVNGSNNIIDELACIERNFSDEIEDVMKCSEVLEEICKFLGVCIFQFQNHYLIVDYNNINTSYRRYLVGSDTLVYQNTVSFGDSSFATKNISTIGVGAEDANITLDGVYNKITVIANTLKRSNPVESEGDSEGENTTTDLFANMVDNSPNGTYETVDVWVNPNPAQGTSDYGKYEAYYWPDKRSAHVWSTTETSGWKHYKVLNQWFKLGSQWQTQHEGILYADDDARRIYNGAMSFDKATSIYTSPPVTLVNGTHYNKTNRWGWTPSAWSQQPPLDSSAIFMNDGVAIQKTFSYDTSADTPTEIKWKTHLTLPLGSTGRASISYPFLKCNRPSSPYLGGGFIINFKFYLSMNNNIADTTVFKEYPMEYDDSATGPDKYNKRVIMFPCTLSIGNHYWNERTKEWLEYPSTYLQKKNDGYYDTAIICLEQSSVYQGLDNTDDNGNFLCYKIWNTSWNDWQYVTKTEYENFSGTKEIETLPENGYYGAKRVFVRKNNHTVFVAPPSYHQEYILDKFYLAKRFKNGDKVFGTEYTLTNTATYELNLNDNSTGIFIPLPEGVTMSGNFKFELGKPTHQQKYLDPNCSYGGYYYVPDLDMQEYVLHISDFYIKYTTINDGSDSSSSSSSNSSNSNNDITYENTIGGNEYVQSLDDVTLKINTYNSQIASWSYVLDKDDKYVTNILYNGASKKMEEHLIDKYTNHFKNPKFKYSGTLHNQAILPCSILYHTQLNTELLVYKTEYNVLKSTVHVETVQL